MRAPLVTGVQTCALPISPPPRTSPAPAHSSSIPSFLGGRILASLALGTDDEWAGSGLVRRAGGLPPEPIRYLGGKVVRSAVARKERAEDAERAPRRVDLLLAGLAPAALVPLKRLPRDSNRANG